jgi:hypothetical protein
MRKLALLILGGIPAFSQFAHAGEGEVQAGRWDAVQARYIIHSGTATYPEAPTNADKALTVLIEGKPAKEVFDLIGPDDKVQCSPDKRDRERTKKGVTCTYTAQLNDPKDFHYTCWVGVNLRTGDGDVRVSC